MGQPFQTDFGRYLGAEWNAEDTYWLSRGLVGVNILRRELLAGIGGSLAVVTAGCNRNTGNETGIGSETEARLEQVAWPEVTSDIVSTWSQVDTRKRFVGEIAGVEIYEKTRIHENMGLQDAVREKTAGQFDETLAQFFASHLDLDGLTTSLATEDRIIEKVAPNLQSQMEAVGIQNVQAVSPGNPLPAYDGAETREFEGYYETPAFERTIDIEDVGERTISLPSKQLRVRGFATTWKIDAGLAFAAGGVYPSSDYEDSNRITITSEKNDGIDAVVVIDLNLDPASIRSDIVNLAEAVELGSTSIE